MNLYKTALSALLLAPVVGGISVQMIHGYQNTKAQAEHYVSEAETQMEEALSLLESEDETFDMLGLEDIEPDMLESDETLSDTVIRFHIRANSDSEEDQTLKLRVRDAVLNYLQPELVSAKNRDDAQAVIEAHLEDIEAVSRAVILEEGYDYEVQAYLTNEEFPIKAYGDLLFPAGEYEALRVDIGNREGANWWCVMYPGLCFVETAGGVVATDGKEELRQTLTPEQYEELLICPEEEVQVEYRSYLWDKWLEKL
jgi:stage II sporulation protein R